MAEQARAYKLAAGKGKESADPSQTLAGLHISPSTSPVKRRPAPPPRSVQLPEEEEEDDFEEEDENDPFADRNAVNSPKVERLEPIWRVV